MNPINQQRRLVELSCVDEEFSAHFFFLLPLSHGDFERLRKRSGGDERVLQSWKDLRSILEKGTAQRVAYSAEGKRGWYP